MRGIVYISLLSFLIGFTAKDVMAQDPQFSQSFAAPLHVNPAFAGVTMQDRIVANYRNQWANLSGGFRTVGISYDHNFRRKNTGLGVSFLRDDSGINGLRFTNLNIAYAHDIKIGRAKGIRTGLNVGYGWRRFDRNNLVFWDQILRDNAYNSLETTMEDSNSYIDAGLGLVYYAPKIWGGVSLQHINEPKNTLLGYQSRIGMKISAHIGAKLVLTKNRKEQSITNLFPVLIFKKQDGWQQMDVGAYISKNDWTLGAMYRGTPFEHKDIPNYLSNDAFIVLAGAQIFPKVRVGYSYDITISNLATNTIGSHELSVIYEWFSPRKNKKSSLIPCPRF